MQTITITAVPAQTFDITLGSQACTITIQQKSTGVFLTLTLNDVVIISSVLCRDRVRLVRQEYLGFVGDLCFMDTQGASDPDYTGFGGRFVLLYLEEADL